MTPAPHNSRFLPKLPVAGLFIRLIALFVDFALILSAIHLFSKSFPQMFWLAGDWSPYLTGLFFFGYFALFNGPAGRGRTIGKMIFRIAVTDEDGNIISWRQSIVRTAVLFPAFVLLPLGSLVFQIPGIWNDYWRSIITTFPTVGITLGALITVVFNPYKQGFHDFLAATFVRPIGNGIEAMSFVDMARTIGPEWRKFHRQPQYSGVVTVLLVIISLGFLSYPGRQTPEGASIYATQYAFKDDNQLRTLAVAIQPRIKGIGTEPNPLPTESTVDSTGTLTLNAWVSHAEAQRINPADLPNIATRIINRYHKDVMPELIKALASRTEKEFRPILAGWQTAPVAYRLVLDAEVSLSPYPEPLSRELLNEIRVMPPVDASTTTTLALNPIP